MVGKRFLSEEGVPSYAEAVRLVASSSMSLGNRWEKINMLVVIRWARTTLTRSRSPQLEAKNLALFALQMTRRICNKERC